MSNEIILAEDFAANENEKKSIREFYKGITAVKLHNDGLNALCNICPSEEFGEDSDCEELQNIIREMFYRITELEAKKNESIELVKGAAISNLELGRENQKSKEYSNTAKCLELEAENKHLKEENFKLAAYQCHNPTSSEYGDMLCKDKIALQELSFKLNGALKVMVLAFDIFGKSAQQNSAMAIAKAALTLMEENK